MRKREAYVKNPRLRVGLLVDNFFESKIFARANVHASVAEPLAWHDN